MLDTVLITLFKITALLGYAAAMTYYMHMFQLNGYKNNEQISSLLSQIFGNE